MEKDSPLLLHFLKVCFGLKNVVAAANLEKEKSLLLLLSAEARLMIVPCDSPVLKIYCFWVCTNSLLITGALASSRGRGGK